MSLMRIERSGRGHLEGVMGTVTSWTEERAPWLWGTHVYTYRTGPFPCAASVRHARQTLATPVTPPCSTRPNGPLKPSLVLRRHALRSLSPLPPSSAPQKVLDAIYRARGRAALAEAALALTAGPQRPTGLPPPPAPSSLFSLSHDAARRSLAHTRAG